MNFQSSNPSSNSMRNYITGFLNTHLPNRTKRIVLFTSLTAQLLAVAIPDENTLHRLNEVLALSTSESALKFPSLMGNVIWKDMGEVLNLQFQMANSADMIAKIVEVVPDWLRYGDDDTMCKDVACLMEHRETVFGLA